MYKDSVYGIRDPVGNRPLALGKLYLSNRSPSSGDGWGYLWCLETYALVVLDVLAQLKLFLQVEAWNADTFNL